MKFGVRECCDVTFRATAPMKLGKKTFYRGEPVMYFDSLKTSSVEGAATTVYAQGGRGNARLLAWEGDRTLTFTMEDALISPEGLSALTGAGLIEADTNSKIYVHQVEKLPFSDKTKITKYEVTSAGVVSFEATLKDIPVKGNGCDFYAMICDMNGNILTEPFSSKTPEAGPGRLIYTGGADVASENIKAEASSEMTDFASFNTTLNPTSLGDAGYYLLVDYYVAKTAGAMQIDIEADKFGGYFYVEASTLFRNEASGQDMPAEFIIPKAKIQSNFTFTMAGSGDPSTFTFTMDAFPAPLRSNSAKKVLAAIQIIGSNTSLDEYERDQTLTNLDIATGEKIKKN